MTLANNVQHTVRCLIVRYIRYKQQVFFVLAGYFQAFLHVEWHFMCKVSMFSQP
jgi:hypothetical protein